MKTAIVAKVGQIFRRTCRVEVEEAGGGGFVDRSDLFKESSGITTSPLPIASASEQAGDTAAGRALTTLDRQEKNNRRDRQRTRQKAGFVVREVDLIFMNEKPDILMHGRDRFSLDLKQERLRHEQGDETSAEASEEGFPAAFFNNSAADDAVGVKDFPAIAEQRRPSFATERAVMFARLGIDHRIGRAEVDHAIGFDLQQFVGEVFIGEDPDVLFETKGLLL